MLEYMGKNKYECILMLLCNGSVAISWNPENLYTSTVGSPLVQGHKNHVVV